MSRMPKPWLITALLILFISISGLAFARSMPTRRVPLNDEISLLDSSTAAEVKKISQLLYRDHKSEMAVLIIKSTQGENAGNYAEKVFNNWGLGQAGVNNGMLILFAIDDRRVEIKPGIRYRNHFTEKFCTDLLMRVVIPCMKAGKPADGVLAAAREVAAEIRRCEETPGGISSQTAEKSPVKTTRSSSPSQKATRSSNSSSGSNSFKTNYLAGVYNSPIRLVIFALIICIIAGGVFYFNQAFSHGRLIFPVWMFVIMVVLTTVIIVGLATTVSDFFDGSLDQGFSGTGVVGLLSLLWCASHVCPRCNKHMSVHNRTLRYATYYSTGLGEKTEHCDYCGHHRVSTYTISRKTRSSSSSSSRSSSSGGGRSSGGGGGASW